MKDQINILIVAADPVFAGALAGELELGGYQVRFQQVETARAMCELLDRSTWDAVISEYALPDFGALQVLRILADRGLDLPCLVVSDHPGEEAAIEAMRAGAKDYLRRGDLSRLVPSLQRELTGAAARREQLRAVGELKERLDFAQMLLDTLPTPIFYNDPDGRYLGCNKAFEQQLGMQRGEIINKSIYQGCPDGLAALYTKGEEALAEGSGPQTFEGTIACADGVHREVICYRATFKSGGSIGGTVGTLLDISERKRRERKQRYQSTHDMLTGIYNRDYFDEELDRLKRGRRFPVSIVVADLDCLKQTNDHLGHAAGDELLKHTALLFRSAFRSEDVVARVGGDEFAALLPGTDEAALSEAMQRLRENLNLGRKGTGRDLLSLSLGAATAHDSEDLIEAWHRADRNMYREKEEHHAGKRGEGARSGTQVGPLPRGSVPAC